MVRATAGAPATNQTVRRPRVTLLLSTAAIAVLAQGRPSRPLLAWNATASAPTGLYLILSREPKRGELAVLRLPDPERQMAADRRYLASNALLIKRVAAHTGDVVCRHGRLLTINGRPTAMAQLSDRFAQRLPRWSGCRQLGGDQLLVLSRAPGSFDGRYFGPIDKRLVIGTALPL